MSPSRLFFTIVLPSMVSLAGCTANTPATPAPPTILIQDADYRGVIFSAAEAERRRLEISLNVDLDRVEFWSPAAADIDRMEAQMLSALLAHAHERLSDGYGHIGHEPARPLAEALPDYGRQYFGYFNTEGEAVIYASFICHASVERLLEEVAVLGGGDCYFQIHYNTDTDEYFDLNVQGES